IVVICGENETKSKCGVSCGRTCEQVRKNITPVCPLWCIGLPRCLCKDGYARHESGTCIPIEKCFNIDDLDVCGKFNETKVCPFTYGVNCFVEPCLFNPCINSSKVRYLLF
ncbi:hypothetical protein B4U80_14531, partial [Leptotrombidium deliense]